MKRITVLVLSCLLALSFLGGCSPAPASFNKQLGAVTGPYKFSLFRWQVGAVTDEVREALRVSGSPNDTDTVNEYFALIYQIAAVKAEVTAVSTGASPGDLTQTDTRLARLQAEKAALKDSVEAIIKRQIMTVLAEEGIYNPLDKFARLPVTFPPLTFELTQPPLLLVISPRAEISRIREVMLEPGLTQEEIAEIEAGADKLGVSSLVVGIGGMAAYPAFVSDEGSLRFTINAVTEEWLHQYLVFRPLGFLYTLDLAGIARNYEIATMNETVAGMVSKEIGARVYEKYYAAPSQTSSPAPAAGFDFNKEMQAIRQAVDKYLARGEVETAERFMEEKRQYLMTQGYYLRKLNQAYFAFYGTYADSPTSISPIGRDLRELRDRSPSLKEFLNIASGLSSYRALEGLIRGGTAPAPTD